VDFFSNAFRTSENGGFVTVQTERLMVGRWTSLCQMMGSERREGIKGNTRILFPSRFLKGVPVDFHGSPGDGFSGSFLVIPISWQSREMTDRGFPFF
jgi:hypothetical protein